MALMVVADEPSDYQRWIAAQRENGVMPTDPDAAAGKLAFLSKPCAACHTVRGTPATGTTGPDLTHIGSRETIAAGLLETTRGSLAAWIADPQTLKPGNNMPMVPLTSVELRDISAYMESLK
jgi:cytochrome c oxidase subunit 2